jgi:hypothetical protein
MVLKRIITLLLLYFCGTNSQPINIRNEYNNYLTVFKKLETVNSYNIFKENFMIVSSINNGDRYYLTQDSDVIPNKYYSSKSMYIYLLDSRQKQNQKVLLCV